MNVYERAYEQKLATFGLDETSRTILWENLPLSGHPPLVEAEVTSFRFLGGTMIWLDIVSSITSGTSPHLLPYHVPTISPESPTKLEEIMGCENWVMLQIGRIAALHERRIQALHQGHFDESEFERAVGDAGRQLQYGISQGHLEGLDISDHKSAAPGSLENERTLVTRFFAYMASVYLHLVAHGFQRLEELDAVIPPAMELLQDRVPTHLLPALVCPLYVIGSVSTPANEAIFRRYFASSPLLDPFFPFRSKILPILEEIWRMRRTIPSVSWKDSLDLTKDVLLI